MYGKWRFRWQHNNCICVASADDLGLPKYFGYFSGWSYSVRFTFTMTIHAPSELVGPMLRHRQFVQHGQCFWLLPTSATMFYSSPPLAHKSPPPGHDQFCLSSSGRAANELRTLLLYTFGGGVRRGQDSDLHTEEGLNRLLSVSGFEVWRDASYGQVVSDNINDYMSYSEC